MSESRGIKLDLQLAMDEARDIMKASESLDNLAEGISERYEDMYNKSSDKVKKFLDKITEETKATQKVLNNLNTGKDLFAIDPNETKKALDQAKKVTVDGLKDLNRFIDENNLKIAQQIGMDPDSPEYKQVVSDGVKAYSQYLTDVGRGIKDQMKQMPGGGAGSPSAPGDIGHQFGTYFLSHLIASNMTQLANSYLVAPIGVEAGKYSRAQTAFDLRSAPGMYQAKQMMEIQNLMADTELKAAQTHSAYSTTGQLGGAAAGMIIGGTMLPGLGMVAGGFIGSQLGGMIGGTIGGYESEEMKAKTIKENAERQARMMRNLQTFQLMEQYTQNFQQFDIARGLFGAKFGGASVGGAGIGYNMAERQQLAYQQGSITGTFDNQTFEDQLNFSRGFGYRPEEIFQAGISTRYTGQNVGSKELMSRQRLADQTGMGARVPELINSMNQLTVSMTQLTGKSDEAALMRFSSLPGMLFGQDNAFGRLSDLGLPMLQRLNAGMMPEVGSVQSIELLRSYSQGNQRRGEESNLFGLTERLQQGVFGENNLSDLLTTATEKSGGNKDMFKSYLHAMTGMNYKQIGLIQEQLAKTEGETPAEQIENWSKNWEQNVEELLDPAERSSGYLQKLADEHTPKSLQYLEIISNEMIKMGELSIDKVMQVTIETTKMHAEMLKNNEKMGEIMRDLINAINQDKTNPTNQQYGPPENQTQQSGFTMVQMPGGNFIPMPVGETAEGLTNFLNSLGSGIVGVFESIFSGPDLRNLNPNTKK